MKKQRLTFTPETALLDGQPFYMAIGDVHYFRIYPTDWERRLRLVQDFGINVIQTYVPWNLHEPKPGAFRFDGIRDLSAYLSLCEKLGLYVLLRPSPYICSEWDLGGLPSWLLRDRNLELRCRDEAYLQAVRAYYRALCPVIKPHLSTNGGCILAMALENEYGSFGCDKAYLQALADMLTGEGMDVPYYTTDGDLHSMQFCGSLDGLWRGANFRAKAGSAASPFALMREIMPDKPFFVGEWWAGRSMHWDEPFSHRDPADIAQGYREALATGGYVAFYMFAGGTNFGFMSGANHGNSFSSRPGTPARYISHMTSYDEDALLSEDGMPTEKYFLCRDALDDYLGRERREHILPEHPTQSITIALDRYAALFDNLDALTQTRAVTASTRPMEDFGQDYGYILYSTDILPYEAPTPETLHLRGVQDRALIYVDGEYQAMMVRDRTAPVVSLERTGEVRRLDVLVENMGRINFGQEIRTERKGILDGIYISERDRLSGITTRTLPMEDLDGLVWLERDHALPPHQPVFYAGTFEATPGVDTFADMRGFGDGFVVVNGFNVGVFRACGPQHTLYIPGGLLREHNEIVIFDSDPTESPETLSCITEALLCSDAPAVW